MVSTYWKERREKEEKEKQEEIECIYLAKQNHFTHCTHKNNQDYKSVGEKNHHPHLKKKRCLKEFCPLLGGKNGVNKK